LPFVRNSKPSSHALIRAHFFCIQKWGTAKTMPEMIQT